MIAMCTMVIHLKDIFVFDLYFQLVYGTLFIQSVYAGRYLSQGNLRDANILMDEIKKQLESKKPTFPESDLIKFVEYLLQT